MNEPRQQSTVLLATSTPEKNHKHIWNGKHQPCRPMLACFARRPREVMSSIQPSGKFTADPTSFMSGRLIRFQGSVRGQLFYHDRIRVTRIRK